MNIQDERIQSACERLTLKAVADQYAVLAQEAVQADHSFSDYLEHCLKAELDARRLRFVLAQYSPNPLQFLLTGADVGNFSHTQRPNVLTPDIENQKTDLYCC